MATSYTPTSKPSATIYSNVSQASTSFTAASKSAIGLTWAEIALTWAEALYSWEAVGGTPYLNTTKP